MPLVIPNTFANAGLNTPTTQLDADFNTIRDYINTRNPTVGPIASRPAPGNAGAIYVASDQDYRTYYDDGASWQTLASWLTLPGVATPPTPASGSGLLFSPSAPTGLRRPRWLDAAGQTTDLLGLLLNFNGMPYKDIVNTNASTSIFTSLPVIKGGTIGADRGLIVEVVGDFANVTGGARAYGARLSLGGQIVHDHNLTGVYASQGGTRYGWQLSAAIWATGAATQVSRVLHTGPAQIANGAGFALTTNTTFVSINTGLTVDLSVDQTFDFLLKPEVNNANCSVRVLSLRAWLV